MKIYKLGFTLIFFLILFSGCASKTFEWVKISPRTGGKDNSSKLVVKRVDLKILLKEKNITPQIIYNNEFPNQEEKLFNRSLKQKIPKPISKKYKKQFRLKNKSELIENVPKNVVLMPEKQSKIKEAVAENSPVIEIEEKPSFKELKAINDSKINNSKKQNLVEKDKIPKKNNYLWIGLILLIIGLITGLVYGSWAYLISMAGIILLVIGYFI